MLTRVHSVTTHGLDPIAVDIEINSSTGIPKIIIIGLVNTAIREAKDRVVSALKNIGVRLKARRTTISLTPANVKKTGSSFDFAIAVGLISLYQKLAIDLENAVFIGEVSLDGSLVSVSQCLLLVLATKKLGYKTVFVPFDNLPDVSLMEGITICGVKNLKELFQNTTFASPKRYTVKSKESRPVTLVGQIELVRAITIAVAGRHHLHVVGPPGVGKSTIPQFAKALLPPLNTEELLETLAIQSLVGEKINPPFCSPHHSSTLQKILGYPTQLKPGALPLAHKGLLFLDEFPEFSTKVLQALRIPLDQKKVQLISQGAVTEFPCDALLLAASNPCPCGYWHTGIRKCICSAAKRAEYSKKLSGPLLERFDLFSQVSPLKSIEYEQHQKMSTDQIVSVIRLARDIQHKRYSLKLLNSDLKIESINQFCKIDKEACKLIQQAVASLNLSTRGYEKLIAVSQTIADLASCPTIKPEHCAEALNYRFEHSWPHQ